MKPATFRHCDACDAPQAIRKGSRIYLAPWYVCYSCATDYRLTTGVQISCTPSEWLTHCVRYCRLSSEERTGVPDPHLRQNWHAYNHLNPESNPK